MQVGVTERKWKVDVFFPLKLLFGLHGSTTFLLTFCLLFYRILFPKSWIVTWIKYKYNFIYVTNCVCKAIFIFQDNIFSIFFLIYQIDGKGKGLPQQAEVAQGVPGRLRPRIFFDVRHYEGVRSSALRTGCLYHNRNPWYSFLEAESTPGHMVLSEATDKIPSNTTENRSRDRQTSSAVP